MLHIVSCDASRYLLFVDFFSRRKTVNITQGWCDYSQLIDKENQSLILISFGVTDCQHKIIFSF